MKKLMLIVAVVAAIAMVAPAQAQDTKFKIYVAAAYVSPLSSEDNVEIGEAVDSIEASDEVGYDVGFEWRMTKLLGLEFDYLYANHDVEFGGAKIAETAMQPFSASLNFHLINTKLLDLYLGATASYVTWGDIEFVDGSSEGADAETAYGAQVGLDIGLGERLAIVTSLRYLQMDVAPENDDGSASVDPLFAKVGLAYRW